MLLNCMLGKFGMNPSVPFEVIGQIRFCGGDPNDPDLDQDHLMQSFYVELCHLNILDRQTDSQTVRQTHKPSDQVNNIMPFSTVQ